MPMPPAVGPQPSRVSVDRADQRAQSIIKPDNKYARAKRLQILRDKTHPEFFPSPNDKNGNEDDDEVAFEREEIRNLFSATSVRFSRRFHALEISTAQNTPAGRFGELWAFDHAPVYLCRAMRPHCHPNLGRRGGISLASCNRHATRD